MSQANVYTSVSNAIWYTDKCEIVTETAISYNVYVTALGTTSAVGNLYSSSVQVAANSRQQIYVGAGNYLTISGSGFTAKANDIIQWSGSAWSVIFDSTTVTNVVYITNAYTGIQYIWENNQWSKSIEGIYSPEQWSLLL